MDILKTVPTIPRVNLSQQQQNILTTSNEATLILKSKEVEDAFKMNLKNNIENSSINKPSQNNNTLNNNKNSKKKKKKNTATTTKQRLEKLPSNINVGLKVKRDDSLSPPINRDEEDGDDEISDSTNTNKNITKYKNQNNKSKEV